MAKSFYEPKKVVRYADNIVQQASGLAAVKAPALRPAVTATPPKTESIPPAAAAVSAPAPAPAPVPVVPTPTPPPPPGFSRAFSFDGATELTGSFSTAGGSRVGSFTLHGTYTPGWSETTTGSFAIFTLNNPSDHTAYKYNISFQRVSGSEGYEDRIVVNFSSASYSSTSYRKLKCSPNFYSGSISDYFIEVYANAGTIDTLREQREHNRNASSTTFVPSFSAIGYYDLLTPADHTMTIGGHNSGSSNYYTGSISNLALSKGTSVILGTQMPYNAQNNPYVDIFYRFEENVSASKGNSDLVVVGTETYVTSSL